MSGRTLSGQTAEAFWHSVSHADLFSIGLNSAPAGEMRPFGRTGGRRTSASVATPMQAAHAFGGYDESVAGWPA